jgi:protein-S-isoprenylcysteine O-methyltransferase Ste14
MDMGSANRTVAESATAGVRVRPPLLFLASLVLGLALDRVPIWQPFSFGEPAVMWWTVGGTGLLVGLALMVAGIRNFARAATPVRGNQPVRALVTTSVHGWSRNPIYLGMFLVYWGIGIAARSPWVLMLTLPLAITMRYVFIAREEAYLERRFGDTYRDYKAHVRRWL